MSNRFFSYISDKGSATASKQVVRGEHDRIRIQPYKYLVFDFNKHSEEWVSNIVIWNHDNTNTYTFSIRYNRNPYSGPFIIRPRCKGLLPKRSAGFGKKMTIKIIYDPSSDESFANYQEHSVIDIKTLIQDPTIDYSDTRKFFRLDIKLDGKLIVRREYFIPIFEYIVCGNQDVLVYPQQSLTFNRNEGNQFSYWKNNFFIINNTTQTVYFKILSTKLPPGSDMVIFPSKGVINYGFADQVVNNTEEALLREDEDQDSLKKFYRIINVLVLQPHKKYVWNSVQKSMTTLVIFFSYHKWPDNDKLDSLRRWANFLETMDIYVNDVTDNVVVKENNVEHLRLLLDYAKHASLNPFNKASTGLNYSDSENFGSTTYLQLAQGRGTSHYSSSGFQGTSKYVSSPTLSSTFNRQSHNILHSEVHEKREVDHGSNNTSVTSEGTIQVPNAETLLQCQNDKVFKTNADKLTGVTGRRYTNNFQKSLFIGKNRIQPRQKQSKTLLLHNKSDENSDHDCEPHLYNMSLTNTTLSNSIHHDFSETASIPLKSHVSGATASCSTRSHPEPEKPENQNGIVFSHKNDEISMQTEEVSSLIDAFTSAGFEASESESYKEARAFGPGLRDRLSNCRKTILLQSLFKNAGLNLQEEVSTSNSV